MDWKTAAAYYESRLSDILNVYRYAMDLAELPQAEVPTRLTERLIQEAEPARRQLERLKKREFRIAVVGLEKAGKSTFINAWLECDLLPAKAARCTFTTTQIYSVKNEADQKLEVQVKTEEQFSNLIQDLQDIRAKEDLATIQQHQTTLNQVRKKGDLEFRFARLEEVKESLRKYVADEKYAHAVLEARLYTSKLAQAEGIVFYDVPGLDSGLAKHVTEAEEMLSDCDAVILVQRFTSLREKELDIIKFTECGDKNVTVADKLFVFLSRIDAQGSPEALERHIDEASQDWLNRANLPSHRIVAGSAGAYLVLNGLAERQTQLEIGDPDAIQNNLRRLIGLADTQINSEGTGIPEIKRRIFQYINTERVEILKKRCDASITTIIETSAKIYKLTKERYPENPDEARRLEEERRQILFSEWWQEKWEHIKAELQIFYNSSVVSNDSRSLVNTSSGIEKFKQRYLEVVTQEMKQLREKTLRDKDTIFAANSVPVFDRAKANFLWRENLYLDVSQTLISIANQLAAELQDEALGLIDYMTNLLWGSVRIKKILLNQADDDFLNKLENSLSVLFLRFARPVAESLIRGPVESDTRNNIIMSLGVDIEIVDNYYTGQEPAFSVLKRYVKHGSDLLFNSELRQRVLGVTDIASQIAGVAVEITLDRLDELQSYEDKVIFEVENDLNAFEEYLRCAIFDAAGFESYCIQELNGLVDKFRGLSGTWAGIAQVELIRGNPKLLEQLPNELKPRELNLEVSERLRQLSAALHKSRTVGANE